ncbi:MAG: hypothetical protein JJU20_13130 [Opitutales bacterium]|nr:hypothetical protein [Opitutales bacterium]
MKLNVRAVLVDSNDKPAARIAAQLCTFNARGQATRRATANSDARGRVQFSLELSDADFQPRLMIRARVGNRLVILSDTPTNFQGSNVDFGNVAVPDANKVGSVAAVRQLTQARTAAVASINKGAVAKAAQPKATESMRAVSIDQVDAKVVQDIQAPLKAQLKELQNFKKTAIPRVELSERIQKEVKKVEQQLGEVIAEKDKRIEQLNEATLKQSSIQNLVLSSQQQIKQAQDSIRESSGAYKLGRVSFKTKLIPNEEGNGFRLPTAQESKDLRDILSEFSYDFAPTSEGERNQSVAVPELVGLTESMARIRAREGNLRLDVRKQSVPADSENVGRVLRQIPASGRNNDLPAGSSVTVLIGRAIESKSS